MWLSNDSKCQIGKDGIYEGAPDLVVEVLSPSSIIRDKRDKYWLYERHEVREYWVVDPSGRLVDVYSLQQGKFTFLGAFTTTDSFASPLLVAVNVALIFPPATS